MSDSSGGDNSPPKQVPIRQAWNKAMQGAILGGFLALAMQELGLNALIPTDGLFMPALVVLGAVAGMTRARRWLWCAAGAAMVALGVIGFTPMMPWLMPALERSNKLVNAPAVVMLASNLQDDDTPNSSSEDRIIHIAEILQGSYADTLVLTQPADVDQAHWTDVIQSQLSGLGLNPRIEKVGPVRNTHDEALAVARLAQQHQWDRIILVTHSWHMRRAAGTFQKAGVQVICSPCIESTYALKSLEDAESRFRAFRDWLHESIGYEWYRWRGWV
jgi:hypothetical protein